MASKEIRIYGDPVLRQKAEPIGGVGQDVHELAADMLATLQDAEGIGLAAPQIGVSRRLIVVHPVPAEGENRDPPQVFINPAIVESSGPMVSHEEGCLSIPGIYEMVKRPNRIRMTALALDGSRIELETEGMLSRIVQHEIDHLDGVLFIDRVGPMRRALLKKKLREFLE